MPDGFDFEALSNSAEDVEKARQVALSAGVPKAEQAASVGNVVALAFDHFVESTLIQPTFVIDYPGKSNAHLLSRVGRASRGCA